jgi:hypothetical protein
MICAYDAVNDAFAELEASLEQVKTLDTDLKNIVYRETDARKVAEYELAKMRPECIIWMDLREASDIDLMRCYKSLQEAQ